VASRESPFYGRNPVAVMDRQQWLAVILVVLMVGSSLVYGVTLAL
jgi:hypothetical protein